MNENTNIRALSVEAWHGFSQEGTNFSVQITVNGTSMQPLIRKGIDLITILPRKDVPRIGDIVLFRDSTRNRYVVHRVWRLRDGFVLTWGDNCILADGWIPVEDILGLTVQMTRNGRTIALNTDAARRRGLLLGWITHSYCRLRHRLHYAASHLPEPVKTVLKKILRGGTRS